MICSTNSILYIIFYLFNVFNNVYLYRIGNSLDFNCLYIRRSPTELNSTNDEVFIDTCHITVKAGDGGDGCLSFRREKHVPMGGPSGGSGGHGGSVYLIGDKTLTNLYKIKLQNYFRATDGENGKGSYCRGNNGKDMEIKLPLGTLIYDANSNLIGELTYHDQKICVARGGRGGRGNFSFRSHRDGAPEISERGEKGIIRDLYFTYKILGDVGLVGLPNSGKSLLLSKITNANPKVAPFPFCTIKPNLGVYESKSAELPKEEIEPVAEDNDETNAKESDDKYSKMIIADIPGIIEDAHKGKGLGLDFLKHIQRCHVLAYIIDGSSSNPLQDYNVIINELKSYDPQLLEKGEVVLLNKSDLVDEDRMDELIESFIEACGHGHVYAISALTGDNLEVFDVVLKKRKECLLRVFEVEPSAQPNEVNYFSEVDDFTKYRPRDFTIKKVSNGVYRLEGKYLERKISMMNLNQYETVLWLNRLLKRHGVFKKVKQQGVQPDEVLLIGEHEFIVPRI